MSRVTEHLDEEGKSYEVLEHERTQTALAEAHTLGVTEDDVVKTIVLDIRTGHAFAVLPARFRVSLEKVKETINSKHVHLATEDEISRDYPEFELGAVPPLGKLTHTPLIVDERVIEHDEVVFAAGSQVESVRMKTRDLFETAQMKVADICEED